MLTDEIKTLDEFRKKFNKFGTLNSLFRPCARLADVPQRLSRPSLSLCLSLLYVPPAFHYVPFHCPYQELREIIVGINAVQLLNGHFYT